jgi:lipopolysaccharide/colanic/teichoic acid biosynthesis glycosyltransferase
VPLSLVLYRIDNSTDQAAADGARLVELLHRTKRVTDILGHVGDDVIAVLCPDTDEEGVKGFMRKLEPHLGDLPFAGVAATFPDDLFDNLANGTAAPPAFKPLIATDLRDQTDHGYVLKRGLDVAGSILAICLLAPVMLLVAAAVKLTSHGPIIFKQTRVGKGGLPFSFYKFRSMVTNADDSVHRQFVADLISKGDEAPSVGEGKPPVYKLKRDSRITPVGRFIRKTSLDELPQFFNVLKGDMSLVGPRPSIPYEATKYQSWHLRRLMSVKPGITGIWQVEGRSRVTFNDMVRMDLRYIQECSLLLDLKIIAKTCWVVVRGVGAD